MPYQALQVLHEDLQANVVREDGLTIAAARGLAIHARRHVRGGGVELREEETRLTAALVADDVPRDGEAVDKEFLREGAQLVP